MIVGLYSASRYAPNNQETMHEFVRRFGEDETHPLASMKDVLSALIENYENTHVPKLALS